MHPLVRYLVISCALVAAAWGCFVFELRGRTVFSHLRAFGAGRASGTFGEMGDKLNRQWESWNEPSRASSQPTRRRPPTRAERKVSERRVARLRAAAKKARKPVVAPKKKAAAPAAPSGIATSVMALKARKAKASPPKTKVDERIPKQAEQALDVILANRLETLLPEDAEAIDDLLDERIERLGKRER